MYDQGDKTPMGLAGLGRLGARKATNLPRELTGIMTKYALAPK